MAAGRQSTTALDRRLIQRTPSQSQSLDLGNSRDDRGKQGRLGMSSELAAWWGEAGGAGGMGEDPLQGCLGREQQARAVYKRCAAAAVCFPPPEACFGPAYARHVWLFSPLDRIWCYNHE